MDILLSYNSQCQCFGKRGTWFQVPGFLTQGFLPDNLHWVPVLIIYSGTFKIGQSVLQLSRLLPNIWNWTTYANHKYLGKLHPWKFRFVKCNRDMRYTLRNCKIKLLFLKCVENKNWQKLRDKHQRNNLVELFCYLPLLGPIEISIFSRRHRS